MLNINLLPWRQTRQQTYQKKIKIICLSGLFISALIISFWHMSLKHQNSILIALLQKAQQQLQTLQTKQKLLESIQQKIYSLQKQEKFIASMDNNQAHNLELLFLISKAVSASIQLDSIEKNNNVITIKGHTYSLSTLAEFMQQLASTTTTWLEPPLLQDITGEKNNAQPEKSFAITLNVKPSTDMKN